MDLTMPDDCGSLGDEILKCYERAVREQKADVAERLLRALEELARLDSSCHAMLDQAYLLIGRTGRVKL